MSRALARIPQSAYNIKNSHLIKTGFIIDDNEEELMTYQNYYLKKLYENTTPTITIATTQSCNLNCPYCFEGNNKAQVNMSVKTCDAILKLISNKYSKGVKLVWFGGEPMLNTPAIEYISNGLNDKSIPFDATIISNGTIFPESFLVKISKYHVSTIQITLDGNREYHNSKRSFRNGQGTYDLILHNIQKLLYRCESKIIIKLNLDCNNLPTFHSIRQYLLEFFSHNPRVDITHNFIRNRTNFDDMGACISDTENFDFFYTPTDSVKLLSDIKGPCPFRISNHIVVSANGDIQKCLEQVGDSSQAIGNVNTSVISVKKSSFYKLFSLPFTRENCANCNILPLCGGGCPMDILKTGEPTCSVLKFRIQQIVKDYYYISRMPQKK